MAELLVELKPIVQKQKSKIINSLRVKAAKKALLTENIVLVEGHARAGKFLVCNHTDGFQRVEHYQHSTIVEQIAYLHGLGLMAEDVAVTLIQQHLDERAYYMRLGRELNMRPPDISSLTHSYDKERYLKRSRNPNTKQLAHAARRDKRFSVFMIHEGMAHINIFFKSFPQLKTISILRHPIDLVYSWHNRGWGKREAADPIAFTLCVNMGGQVVPWYAARWAHRYVQMSTMDRIITALRYIASLAQNVFGHLPLAQKNRILVVTYEQLCAEPRVVIERIGNFLAVRPSVAMPNIVRREKMRGGLVTLNRKEKTEAIRKKASKQPFRELMVMAEEYEKNSQSGLWVQ